MNSYFKKRRTDFHLLGQRKKSEVLSESDQPHVPRKRFRRKAGILGPDTDLRKRLLAVMKLPTVGPESANLVSELAYTENQSPNHSATNRALTELFNRDETGRFSFIEKQNQDNSSAKDKEALKNRLVKLQTQYMSDQLMPSFGKFSKAENQAFLNALNLGEAKVDTETTKKSLQFESLLSSPSKWDSLSTEQRKQITTSPHKPKGDTNQLVAFGKSAHSIAKQEKGPSTLPKSMQAILKRKATASMLHEMKKAYRGPGPGTFPSPNPAGPSGDSARLLDDYSTSESEDSIDVEMRESRSTKKVAASDNGSIRKSITKSGRERKESRDNPLALLLGAVDVLQKAKSKKDETNSASFENESDEEVTVAPRRRLFDDQNSK